MANNLLKGGIYMLTAPLKVGQVYVIPLLPPPREPISRTIDLTWHLARYDYADLMASGATMFWYLPAVDREKQDPTKHRQIAPRDYRKRFQGRYIRKATPTEVKTFENLET